MKKFLMFVLMLFLFCSCDVKNNEKSNSIHFLSNSTLSIQIEDIQLECQNNILQKDIPTILYVQVKCDGKLDNKYIQMDYKKSSFKIFLNENFTKKEQNLFAYTIYGKKATSDDRIIVKINDKSAAITFNVIDTQVPAIKVGQIKNAKSGYQDICNEKGYLKISTAEDFEIIKTNFTQMFLQYSYLYNEEYFKTYDFIVFTNYYDNTMYSSSFNIAYLDNQTLKIDVIKTLSLNNNNSGETFDYTTIAIKKDISYDQIVIVESII